MYMLSAALTDKINYVLPPIGSRIPSIRPVVSSSFSSPGEMPVGAVDKRTRSCSYDHRS